MYRFDSGLWVALQRLRVRRRWRVSDELLQDTTLYLIEPSVDLPTPIIPFPIPPVGFPPPPPGTSNPEQQCSTTNLPKCSDCGGNEGWCQSGDSVGCPCQEECKEDAQPTCSDESCKGDDSSKCTQGPEQGCDCATDDECPADEELLPCSECGGQDSEQKCNGLEDEGGLYKGCDCWDDTKPTHPYKAFNAAQFAAGQAKMAGLPDVGSMPPSPTSSSAPTATADPSKVTCWNNNVPSVPGKLIAKTGTIDPNTLLLRLREGSSNVIGANRPELKLIFSQWCATTNAKHQLN